MSDKLRLFALVHEDWQTHGRDWTKPGFRAVAVHRFGVWRMGVSSRILRAPLSIMYRILYRHCRNTYGIELPFSVQLGRRVIFEHQGGIVIHGNTIIGDGCIIRQHCTLGIRNMDDPASAPILGNHVQLGAGAVVLGRVRLGDGASIGANSVVLTDVPAGALAVGTPASVRLRA